jgi:hypothetical protein
MKKDSTKVAAESSKSTIEKNLEKLEYPATEDIFVQLDQDKEMDIEAIPNNKKLENKPELWDENALPTQGIGSDLDIPGSELDDAQEQVGSEDEENNFYSESDTK